MLWLIPKLLSGHSWQLSVSFIKRCRSSGAVPESCIMSWQPLEMSAVTSGVCKYWPFEKKMFTHFIKVRKMTAQECIDMKIIF